MVTHHLHRQPSVVVNPPPAAPVPLPAGLDLGLFPGQILAHLTQDIESVQRGFDMGSARMIIRFKNGFGAIISASLHEEGVYEVAPLRFWGPGPDNYELHFRSHVADLTWCSQAEEMVGVCQQISRLLPGGRV